MKEARWSAATRASRYQVMKLEQPLRRKPRPSSILSHHPVEIKHPCASGQVPQPKRPVM